MKSRSCKINKESLQDNAGPRDICGVDINDPIGNHLVNFTFQIIAKEDPTKPYDGDVDLILPHSLPRAAKPPKVEITNPETNWSSKLTIQIDDSFINNIREKQLIYRIEFSSKSTTSGRGKVGTKRSVSIPNHIFFVDASCLLVRGGKFTKFLSYSASCKPPGFSEFSFNISIDHPLLSDSQIYRHRPFVCFIKSIHQIPETNNESYIAPYLNIIVDTQKYTTIPQGKSSDLKINSALVLFNTKIEEIQVELHDQETDPPDLSKTIGSGLVDLSFQKQIKHEQISIDQILGIQGTSSRPFGKATVKLESSRCNTFFQAINPRNSLSSGNYTENGTYASFVLENLSDFVSPPKEIFTRTSTPATPKRSSINQQLPVEAAPPMYFNRYVIYGYYSDLHDLEKSFIESLLNQINIINSEVFGVDDLNIVTTLKVESDDSSAISGFYLISSDIHIMVFEVIKGSNSQISLDKFLSTQVGTHLKILSDQTVLYPSPRLYKNFDSAIKRIHLSESLSSLICEPQLYVKHSTTSNLSKVLNQLHLMTKVTNFNEMNTNELWPHSHDLEILNIKKGIQPQNNVNETKSQTNYNNNDNTTNNEIPKTKINNNFIYVPISNNNKNVNNNNKIKNFNYYQKRNKKIIKNLENKKHINRNIIHSDNEYEIWYTNDPNSLRDKEWTIEYPEENYNTLAELVSDNMNLKRFREENGKEIKNGKRFNCNVTNKTYLEPLLELKSGKNNVPWNNKDLSLANASERWLKESRGPIYSKYNSSVHPNETFDQVKPIFIDEEYNDPIPLSKMIEKKYYNNNIKNDVIKENENVSLRIQEPYKDLIKMKNERLEPSVKGKPLFHTMFQTSVKKGYTDSETVKKLTTTFPGQTEMK